MRRAIVSAPVLVAITVMTASAAIINIPDDHPTIQRGIDASSDGDTVLVQPGNYKENINFNARNIVVGSLFLTTADVSYIYSTIIDGDSSGSVITFVRGENRDATIIGFTIENGLASFGGGVFCSGSRPSILYNVISFNWASIEGNVGYGGGIYCLDSAPLISGNIISNNTAGGFEGGHGGGIFCENSGPVVINNLIYGNDAGWGGGVISISPDLVFINNTLYGNYAIWETGGIRGLCCESNVIINSVIWNNMPTQISGSIVAEYSDVEGGWQGEGNIDVNPLFRDPEGGDFHLMADSCGDIYNSPCIDAGDPAIFDSTLGCDRGLGELRSDMGAYGGARIPTDIDEEQIPEVPREFILSQNYPNPFNASTTIEYSLPEGSSVTIDIYDILGRRVEMLVQGEQQAGYHRVVWDAEHQSSGIYIYCVKAGAYTESKSCLLLK